MHHICTLFNSNYLPRGIALYRSLQNFDSDFTFWVLCLDKSSEKVLNSLNKDNIVCIPLVELEANAEDLLNVKSGRNIFEYYFTCKSYLLKYILDTNTDIDKITYVDADIYFYSSYEEYEKKIMNYSVALTPHRFPNHLKTLIKYGKFNAGMISFKNDVTGRLCLDWWCAKCTEWCFDIIEDNRFADQKYLDEIPLKFESVYVFNELGINTGPWNMSNYKILNKNKRLYIRDSKLICYHFHGISRIFESYFDSGYTAFGRLSDNLKNTIYKPYLNTIVSIENELIESGIDCIIGDRRNLRLIKKSEPKSIIKFARILKVYSKYVKSFFKNGIVKAVDI